MARINKIKKMIIMIKMIIIIKITIFLDKLKIMINNNNILIIINNKTNINQFINKSKKIIIKKQM